MKQILIAAVVILLAACQSETQESVPTYQVAEQDFTIEVSGFGEIEAAKATRIITPGRQAMVIAWLAPENLQVKQGDVIAKFDAEKLIRDSRQEELTMQLLEQDIETSYAKKSQQINEVNSEQSFVEEEFAFVDKFAIDDLRLYSQLEIIDTMQNRDFLGAKEGFLEWKEGSIGEQTQSALDVLDIKRSGHEVKFKQHKQALSQLNVYAPNDGLLTYQKDRRGEKPSVGQTVFPGRPIAILPDLSNMQAKLFVLANEAINLTTDLPVTVKLTAFPEQTFTGTVQDVSGFPRSIERGSPITYYEVTVALNEQNPDMMQPGRKLTGQINVQSAQPKLIVPLQSLYHQQDRSFVYVKDGSEFVAKDVTTGEKNLYFVHITSGLQAGDTIALSSPDGQG